MVHEIAPAPVRALNRLITLIALFSGGLSTPLGLTLYWTTACIALDLEIVEVQGKSVSDRWAVKQKHQRPM